jgi:hypothetical protein
MTSEEIEALKQQARDERAERVKKLQEKSEASPLTRQQEAKR